MDGLTFTRKIRGEENKPNPYIPIILLTGHTEKDQGPPEGLNDRRKR